MEFGKTSICGTQVDVIFTGGRYLFHNDFYGWIAIAERTEESKKNVCDDQEFVLFVGNHYTVGGHMTNSVILKAVKEYIRKNECKFVERECKFREVEADLAYTSVGLNINGIMIQESDRGQEAVKAFNEALNK